MSNEKPRWGYWSRGVRDLDYFEMEKVRRFGSEVGVTKKRALAELQNELRTCAADYWLGRQWETGVRTAEVRPALKRLRRNARVLISAIGDLDEMTRRCIIRGYRASEDSPDRHSGRLIDGLGEALRRFEFAVEDGLDTLPKGKAGRRPLTALRDLALPLARIYQRRMGKQWTYDQPVNRHSEHMSPSAGAIWVSRLIQHIDGKVTRENLDTVLREIPSRLRESRKPPPNRGDFR